MVQKKSTKTQQQQAESAEQNFEFVEPEFLVSLPTENKSFAHETAQCIRAYLQNWRQGTVAVKGRGDVAFSNRKPWKQKGTGRARAGSLRSPLWRKGGVIFGPQARTRTLKIGKKIKNKVLNRALHDYVTGKKIIMLPWALEGERPKTAYASKLLKKALLHDSKINLFIAPQDLAAHSSFANLPNVRVMFFDQPNVYDLLNSDYWVILKKDIELFKKMVHQWS
jgi:large subunit ribosomal protein L4